MPKPGEIYALGHQPAAVKPSASGHAGSAPEGLAAAVNTKPSARGNGWRRVGRYDLAKPPLFPVPSRCQRCGRRMRFVCVLENREGQRLAVGKQCARQLRKGADHAKV
jgi:hypothetical protein